MIRHPFGRTMCVPPRLLLGAVSLARPCKCRCMHVPPSDGKRQSPRAANTEPIPMLTQMRSKSTSLVVKLLFILLIASFAVWGIGDILRQSSGGGLMTVGEIDYTINDIDRTFQAEVRRISPSLTVDSAIQLGLLDSAISLLASRGLYSSAAADMGLVVGDERVQRFLVESSPYSINGQFDRDMLLQDLANRGLSEQEYIATLRRDIARQALLDAMVSGAEVPMPVAETLVQYYQEARTIALARVPVDSVPAPEEIDDAVLEAFYEENADDYMAPEYREISAIVLDPELMAAGVPVSEEKLAEEYEYRLPDLIEPESRAINQMILSEEILAIGAAEALADGQAFEEVAAEVAGQEPDTIPLGTFTRDNWILPEATDAVFGLAEGGVTDPIETPFGWRIFQAAEVTPEFTPTLDDVREELSFDIAVEIAEDEIDPLAETIMESIAGQPEDQNNHIGLAETAELIEMPLLQTGAVDIDGNDPDGNPVEFEGDLDAMLVFAFQRDTPEPSTLQSLDNGGLYVLTVDTITAPALRPFEDVRDQVEKDWIAAQQLAGARAIAEDVAARVQEGQTMSFVTGELGLEAETVPAVLRTGGGAEGIPASLLEDLFAAGLGEALLVDDGDSVLVAQVTAIAPPEGEEAETAVNALMTELRAQQAEDIFAQFGVALQGQFPVEVQYATIRSLYEQPAQ